MCDDCRKNGDDGPIQRLFKRLLVRSLEIEGQKADEIAARIIKSFIRHDHDAITAMGHEILADKTQTALVISALGSIAGDLWQLQYEAHNPDASETEILGSLDVALKARTEKCKAEMQDLLRDL